MKNPGNIIANKLIKTNDNVEKNTKYDKTLLVFCSKIEFQEENYLMN